MHVKGKNKNLLSEISPCFNFNKKKKKIRHQLFTTSYKVARLHSMYQAPTVLLTSIIGPTLNSCLSKINRSSKIRKKQSINGTQHGACPYLNPPSTHRKPISARGRARVCLSWKESPQRCINPGEDEGGSRAGRR